MGTYRRPEPRPLAPELRRLLDAVADQHRQTGLHPTLDELAGVLGVAKSTVSVWRGRLGALGLLRFDPESRRSTRSRPTRRCWQPTGSDRSRRPAT